MIPPQGAVPQQQAQGGVPAAPQAPRGAAPQMAKQGAGKADPEILRQSPRVKQALELYLGRPVDMSQVPDNILIEVAGMVAKLGVEGAVAMAQKMIPQDIQRQLKQGAGNANPQPNA